MPGFPLIGRPKIADLIKKGEYGTARSSASVLMTPNEFREFVKYVDEFQPSYLSGERLWNDILPD